jgi:hypothetical protein
LKVIFNQRTCLTFLLFAFAAVILYLTLGLGSVARMVPFAVVIPTLLLLLFQLMMDMLPRLAQKYSRLENKDLFQVEGLRKQVREPVEDVEVEALQRNRERKAFLWLLVMLILIYLLGFLIALPLYTLVYLKRRSEKWLIAVPVAVGIGCLVYGVSILNLGTRLYGGLLWQWLKM